MMMMMVKVKLWHVHFLCLAVREVAACVQALQAEARECWQLLSYIHIVVYITIQCDAGDRRAVVERRTVSVYHVLFHILNMTNVQAPLNLRNLWRYINQFLTFNIYINTRITLVLTVFYEICHWRKCWPNV